MATNLFVLLGFAALCTVISDWALLHRRKVSDWVVGLLFGAMAIVAMFVPVHTRSGIVVDCRVGVVGTAALLGGPVTALTCLPLPCLYRVGLCGPDVYAEVFEILCAGVLGSACNVWIRRARQGLTFQRVLLFSLVTGVGAQALAACLRWSLVRSPFAGADFAGFVVLLLSAPVSMAMLTTTIVLEKRHFRVIDDFAEAERRMLHSQKMAALGQIAHKIAHSFLNELTVIMGVAEEAKREARSPGAVEPLMDEVVASVSSLAGLTGELVAFSVPSATRYRKMDLSRCLTGVEQLLSKVIGQEVEVFIDGRQEAGVVNVDPNRIEQIIVHMAINAAEAMAGRGRLTISAKPAVLSGAELRRLQAGECEKDRHAGSFAVLSVQDTGCGMTEEVASRVFEPFFSTKGKHEKTGLGLASVYNIVRTHKGFVDIQTRPGCGTTFLVYLPVVG